MSAKLDRMVDREVLSKLKKQKGLEDIDTELSLLVEQLESGQVGEQWLWEGVYKKLTFCVSLGMMGLSDICQSILDQLKARREFNAKLLKKKLPPDPTPAKAATSPSGEAQSSIWPWVAGGGLALLAFGFFRKGRGK